MPLTLLGSMLLAASSLSATTYYVDAGKGNDKADGLSQSTAWQSVSRVNCAKLQAGDSVLFKRGCVFRGTTLQLASGEPGKPILYSAYGEGTKPILQTSLDYNSPDKWVETAPNLWQNVTSFKYELMPDSVPLDLRKTHWEVYSEFPSQVTCEETQDNGQNIFRIVCTKQGKVSTNIQFLGPDVVSEPVSYILKCRFRATKPFVLPLFRVMHKNNPWSSFAQAAYSEHTVTETWQEADLFLTKCGTNTSGAPVRLNAFCGTAIPDGCVFEFAPISLQKAVFTGLEPLTSDIGNIIFNHGETCGWKRWSVEQLKNEYDYFHDPASNILTLRHTGNPGGGKYTSLELCRKVAVVSHGGAHDAIVDGIWARYTGSHGFGGMYAKRVTIRNCDISYIGGSVLYVRDGHSTRYGNGVEFWCQAEDCTVENNRIWQVYDVAITNQGTAPNHVQRNLIYRNNLIFQCEQSYEYWRSPESALTENVQFVNNTCLQAGQVWSHWQRPNKHSCHLLGYGVSAVTRNVIIKHNVFCNALEALLLHHDDWRKAMDCDENLWWQDNPDGMLLRIYKLNLALKINQFPEWQNTHGKDRHSLVAKPVFVKPDFKHPENGDFHLAPNSPGAGVMGIR